MGVYMFQAWSLEAYGGKELSFQDEGITDYRG